jgi:hypothetical protein
MKLLKNEFCSYFSRTHKLFAFVAAACVSGLMLAQPALAEDVTVASPINGTSVESPVWVRAHNVGCNGLTPTEFGFSIDSGALTRGASANDVDVINVGLPAGPHTIHFKSSTANGACPVVNTTFNVVGSGAASSANTSSASSATASVTAGALASAAVTASIPSNATNSGILDGKNWIGQKDGGTPGSAHFSSVYPARTPSGDNARKFYMTYTKHGGVRWHISFAKNASATHFIYDTYVYLTNPSQVANIELDMNQVMSNGRTVIYGMQCSSYSNRWEYVYVKNGAHWRPSSIPCSPKTWKANTWHHIQIASHRNSSGVVTYDYVNLDGAHHGFSNATVAASEHLGWAPGTLLINFQLDGASGGSGSITAFAHKMTVFHW